ncbi:MAG: hypothetical protein ABL931_21030, partial [Usitatibacteraceae bacterium]
SRADLEAVAARHPEQVTALVADVRDGEALATAAERAVATYGRLDAAVAATSGWYTMPDTAPVPAGWGGDVAGLATPAQAMQRPLTILLGTEDIDRDDPNLRKTEEADRQGLTRFARGHAFLAAGRKYVDAQASFGWGIAYAPGIGHDNAGMAPFAIPYLLGSTGTTSQADTSSTGAVDLAQLREQPNVVAALATITELESDWAIQRLIELTEIPAPPFGEGARAQAFARMLREIGGLDVHIDEIGNVIARRKGHGDGPPAMLVAHLDTVFPSGTDVKVRREGNRFTAPGIGDNTRGLVSLLLLER